MIEFRNISKIFHQKGKAVTALDNISFVVPKGKIMGVIGASGAGKSTLIRCVNLLEHPTSGKIIVDGQDMLLLSRAGLAQARRQIGMIFQHFNLLASRTVFDNVAFPLELIKTSKSQIQKRVNELLALVGLEDKSNEYPANLSGGQKQRVAIARSLAASPKVLLCDEATSALDPATTSSILALIKDINTRLGITVLLITHEMTVVKAICDQVAVISKGVLIEQGSVADVFTNPGTELAKDFLASSVKLEIPSGYQARMALPRSAASKPLIRLEFTGQSVDDPVLSEVARLFGVDNNILGAQIEYAGHVKFGVLLLEASGTAQNIESSLRFYESRNIRTEILGYV